MADRLNEKIYLVTVHLLKLDRLLSKLFKRVTSPSMGSRMFCDISLMHDVENTILLQPRLGVYSLSRRKVCFLC